MTSRIRAEGGPERSPDPGLRGVRWLTRVALALLIVGLALAPAHAASHSVNHPLHESSGAIPISLALTAMCVLALVGICRSGRRAALLSLALLVLLFGFETALHSVHHFFETEGGTSCALLSASQHDSGACTPTSEVAGPTWTIAPSPAVDSEPIRTLRLFGAPENRAPPARPSV